MHTYMYSRCRVNYLGLLSTLSSPYQYSIYGISFYTTLYIPTQHRLQLHDHPYLLSIFSPSHTVCQA